MNRISPVFAAVLAAVAVLTLPTLASAIGPQKGVLLKGTLHDGSLTAVTKPTDLKVASTGKTARFTWWCGKQETISKKNAITVAIKPDGSFAGTSNVGNLTVWTVKGRFVTATSARASLRLIATCDAKGGLASLKASGAGMAAALPIAGPLPSAAVATLLDRTGSRRALIGSSVPVRAAAGGAQHAPLPSARTKRVR